MRRPEPVLDSIERRRRRLERDVPRQPLLRRRVARQFDFHRELLERLAIDELSPGGFAAGQIATVERVIAFRARETRRRENVVQVRTRADGESVKIFPAAAINEIVQGEDKLAVCRRDERSSSWPPASYKIRVSSIRESISFARHSMSTRWPFAAANLK